MHKAKIFISHSAKEELAERTVATLVAGLDDRFEVLCDREPERLLAGTSWRESINNWIVHCDAAVVVFSPSALQSPWVAKEVTNLMLRRSQDRSFLIVPVLVDGVTFADLRNPQWSPDQLAEVQAILVTHETEVLASLARQLEAIGLRYGPRSALYELELVVTTLLAKLHDVVTEFLAEQVGLDLTGWVLPGDKPLVLARRLFDAELDELFHAMLKLLQHDRDAARRIYELAAPFTWVDPAAAVKIADALPPRIERPKPISLNSDETLTGRAYVRYACGPELEIRELTPDYWEWGADHQAQWLREELKAGLGIAEGDNTSDAMLDADLAEEVVIVLARTVNISDEVVRNVQGALPHLALFLLSGNQPEEEIARRFPGVQILVPRLHPEREARSLAAYRRHRRKLAERSA